MNFENKYWYFNSALPNHFCDKLIKYASSKNEQLGITGGFGKEGGRDDSPLTNDEINNLKKRRDSNIVWLSEHWLYRYIHYFVHLANRNAGWNFQWDYSEAAQFTKYKLNQFYDWHCDSWDKPYPEDEKDSNVRGKIRKLSVTCSLSDPKDYKGGDFEFRFQDKESGKHRDHACKEIRPKGSIVVFPSYLYHRVQPVTEGTRYSLVLWNCGQPYK